MSEELEWVGFHLKYDPTRRVPDAMVDKVIEVKRFMEDHNITTIHGIGDVYKATRMPTKQKISQIMQNKTGINQRQFPDEWKELMAFAQALLDEVGSS